GTARMANDGATGDPLLWITTSPVSGMLSGMLAFRKTHVKVLLLRPTAFQNDLERRRPGSVSEGVVGLHDVVETESMRDESRGTKLARLHQFEQQWRRHRVDEARRERDVAVPQFLEMQLHRLTMDADVRDASPRAHNGLAGVECRRRADRLDREVHSHALGDRQDPRHGVFSRAVDDGRRAKSL